MAINNFKPFATGAGANVLSQADYESLAALSSGFQAGKASSAQINKALRQGAVMASVLAQFVADSSGNDVLDNGSTSAILANLKAGLLSAAPGRLLGLRVFTASSTYTPTPGTKSIEVEVQGGGGRCWGIYNWIISNLSWLRRLCRRICQIKNHILTDELFSYRGNWWSWRKSW